MHQPNAQHHQAQPSPVQRELSKYSVPFVILPSISNSF